MRCRANRSECLSDDFQVSGDSIAPWVCRAAGLVRRSSGQLPGPPPHKWRQPARSRFEVDRALAANTYRLAPSKLRQRSRPRAPANERPNPEATYEVERETPRQALASPCRSLSENVENGRGERGAVRPAKAELA